ncbi:MAG: hypothetical protein RIQ79_1179 [Verrucomicrobiota bacterium]
MTWGDYGAVAVMGLLGSAHCVGMCAPFALAVSAGARLQGGLALLFARHVAYQLGKATAYVFLGVLLFLAAGWVDIETPLGRAQDLLAWVAGGVMILIGAGYATGWRWSGGAPAGWAGRACGSLQVLWTRPTLWRCVLTGWINGFLPCGLSLAALLFLVSRDQINGVVAGAYVFGFATLPGLLLTGFLGEKISPRLRGRGLRFAGVLLIAFGVLTLVRGRASVHGWFHEHLLPSDATHAGHSHGGQ